MGRIAAEGALLTDCRDCRCDDFANCATCRSYRDRGRALSEEILQTPSDRVFAHFDVCKGCAGGPLSACPEGIRLLEEFAISEGVKIGRKTAAPAEEMCGVRIYYPSKACGEPATHKGLFGQKLCESHREEAEEGREVVPIAEEV